MIAEPGDLGDLTPCFTADEVDAFLSFAVVSSPALTAPNGSLQAGLWPAGKSGGCDACPNARDRGVLESRARAPQHGRRRQGWPGRSCVTLSDHWEPTPQTDMSSGVVVDRPYASLDYPP
jgi:hypothetical protein